MPSGSGTHSDRSMRLAGTLMFQASGEVVAQAKAVEAVRAAYKKQYAEAKTREQLDEKLRPILPRLGEPCK